MATDRTTIRLSDERKRLLDEASKIVASDPSDDPPRSDVIDAALTHLVESTRNARDARGQLDPETIQTVFNTSAVALHYRTSVDSRWR